MCPFFHMSHESLKLTVCTTRFFAVYNTLRQRRLASTPNSTYMHVVSLLCVRACVSVVYKVWNLFGDAPTTDSWGVVGGDVLKALGAMFLAGPLLTGYTQVPVTPAPHYPAPATCAPKRMFAHTSTQLRHIHVPRHYLSSLPSHV